MNTRLAGYFDTAAGNYWLEGDNYRGADEYVEIEPMMEYSQVIVPAVERRCELKG